MFLFLLAFGNVEQLQEIAFQGLNLEDIVQVILIDLKFLDFVDDDCIFELLLSIEPFHDE
jgi:hypothetical protein